MADVERQREEAERLGRETEELQRELTEKETEVEQLGRERERQSGKEVKALSQSADELSKRCVTELNLQSWARRIDVTVSAL